MMPFCSDFDGYYYQRYLFRWKKYDGFYLLVHVVDERVVCITVEVVLVDMMSIFIYMLLMSFSISLIQLQTPGTFKENHFLEK